MARRLAKRAEEARRLTVDADGLADFFGTISRVHPDRKALAALCIGTDRSTGDAFGPLLGSLLNEQGWPHVIGTLEAPCDAHRLAAAVAALPAGTIVLAFDACLGKEEDIGKFTVLEGPLRPAAAIGGAAGMHAPVGHYSVAAVVGRKSVKPLWELQSASLHKVMGMTRTAANALLAAWSGPVRAE